MDIEFHTGAGPRVARLRAADEQRVLSFGDGWIACCGNHAEVARIQLENDFAGLARREVNALKAAQSQQGRALYRGKLQVQFSHFVTRQFSGIRDHHLGSQRITRLDCIRVELEIVVLEGGIAQPESEWEERLAGEVAVGSALHRVVAEGRQLIEAGIKSDGQSTSWIVAA